MNAKKLFALLLAAVMVLSVLTGCQVKYQEIDLADVIEHEDYTSVYETIGANITIDMVVEDPDTGLATVEYEGTTYELGMDFLSYAMVYNCTPAGEYKTAEDVFNQWEAVHPEMELPGSRSSPVLQPVLRSVQRKDRELCDHSLLGSRRCHYRRFR